MSKGKDMGRAGCFMWMARWLMRVAGGGMIFMGLACWLIPMLIPKLLKRSLIIWILLKLTKTYYDTKVTLTMIKSKDRESLL
jgi:hypothetical protein